MRLDPPSGGAVPFIVFEGLDGAGKSTLARVVAERLGAVLLTTPPTAVRAVRATLDEAFPRASASSTLFYAAGVVAVSDRIARLRADAKAPAVIVDRYWLSTRAYARVLGVDLALPEVEALLVPATLTVFVTASHATRCGRLERRGDVLAHDLATFETSVAVMLAAAYDELLRMPVAGRVLRLDSSEVTPDVLADEVLRALAEIDGAAPVRVSDVDAACRQTV